MDYEHQELENKIHEMERQLDDLRYDIQRLQDDKADKSHYHKQYQAREEY